LEYSNKLQHYKNSSHFSALSFWVGQQQQKKKEKEKEEHLFAKTNNNIAT